MRSYGHDISTVLAGESLSDVEMPLEGTLRRMKERLLPFVFTEVEKKLVYLFIDGSIFEDQELAFHPI